VDRTGPQNDGEGPEDSDPTAADPGDAPGAEDEFEVRGWVPPEERPWRHPSEVLSPAGSRPGVAVAARPANRSREAWISALVGASAATIVVVAGLFMASPKPAGLTGASEGRSSQPRLAGRSLVALLATGSGGTSLDCAVAVAPGGLVATSADALAGATSVDAWRAGRWVPATIVATDASSDVGLVRVPFAVPVAQFTDESGVARGARVWTMDVTAPLGSRGTQWSASEGTVSAAGTAVNGTRGQGMPSIVVVSALGPDTTGGVLIGADGSVLGIQDTSVASGSPGEVFLPADLVVGVSADLAAEGTVSHGWLGINGGNETPTQSTPPPGGAVVETVDPSGPAANVLEQGDVIVAVDDVPIRSMADLRSRLYMLPPGSPVWLRLWRHDSLTTVEVDLGSSP
jgi:S1-C subfamily serine protease